MSTSANVVGTIIGYTAAATVCVFAVVTGMALGLLFIGLFSLVPGLIVWLCTNWWIAPAFGWPHLSFLTSWAGCTVLGVLGRLLFGRKDTKVEIKTPDGDTVDGALLIKAMRLAAVKKARSGW